mmetsp:Transcript_22454/g.59272  ORF Transcript_22454/g.59272 Transcript_22454/m.59272 type:complete len:196 (+) Transcript_22454:60-647(+)
MSGTTMNQVAYYRVNEEAFKREVKDLRIRKDWSPTLKSIRLGMVAGKITSSPLNSPRLQKATPRSLEAAGNMALNSARGTAAELRRKSGSDAASCAATEAGAPSVAGEEAVADPVSEILQQLARPGGRQPLPSLSDGPQTSSMVIGWMDGSNAALASMERRNHARWTRTVRSSDVTTFAGRYSSMYGCSPYSNQK